MKKILLLLLLFVGLLPQISHAQTAKAIWCAGNTTLYFTYDTKTYTAGGTYDGQTITNVYSVPASGFVPSGGSSFNLPLYSIRTSVTRVVIETNYTSFQPTSLAYYFYEFRNLTTVTGLENINTSNVTTLFSTFYGCGGITSLEPLRNWDTSNVTTLENTFNGCSGITSLEPLSGWNISNDTTLYNTFAFCRGFTSLEPLRNWVTSNVTNMNSTFNCCSGITSLDGLSRWNTANVKNMSDAFKYCSGITSLEPLSGWDISNDTTLQNSFYGCSGITSLEPLSNWITGNVKNMSFTFGNCSGITSLDGLSRWNTANVTDMRSTFYGCSGITSLEPLSNWITGNVKNMSYTFSGCRGITSLEPLSNWITGNVKTLQFSFNGCSGITSLDGLSRWNTANVTTLGVMFSNCSGITSLDGISNWDTGKVKNLSRIFYYCNSLITADLSGWDTSKVSDMREMMESCQSLTSVTFGQKFSLESISTSYSTSYPGAYPPFDGCRMLRYIDFYASDDTDAITSIDRTNSTNMFYNIPNTTVIYLPHGASQVTGNTDNVVYTDNGELHCDKYYSEDKVDIEFPRDFKTNEATYTRTMSNNYGSAILPYAFTTNENIQAYKQDKEYADINMMFFKDVETVAAHTPFAFKKLASGRTADFTMTDSSENFGITVYATRSTKADEDTWTGEKGAPYEDITGNISQDSNLSGWSTKGYYVNQTLNSNTDGPFFYIAQEKFKSANGNVTLPPHRVSFHNANQAGAKNLDIMTSASEDEIITAIEEAELRKTEREAEAFYDTAGRRVEKLRPGINIVRMTDGTVKKVIIR